MPTFLSSRFLTNLLLLFWSLLHPCCSHTRSILCEIHTLCMRSPFPIVNAKWSPVFRSVNHLRITLDPYGEILLSRTLIICPAYPKLHISIDYLFLAVLLLSFIYNICLFVSRFGTFGGLIEYSAEKKVSHHSHLSATMCVGIPLGVQLRLRCATPLLYS